VRDVTRQNQLRLFDELVETQTTRDLVDNEGGFLRPPPGPGWRVADAHRERHTQWQRRKPIVSPRLWRRKC
jgi:hypothetical protein